MYNCTTRYRQSIWCNKNEHMMLVDLQIAFSTGDFRVPSLGGARHARHRAASRHDAGRPDRGRHISCQRYRHRIATPTRTQDATNAALGEARGQTYGEVDGGINRKVVRSWCPSTILS